MSILSASLVGGSPSSFARSTEKKPPLGTVVGEDPEETLAVFSIFPGLSPEMTSFPLDDTARIRLLSAWNGTFTCPPVRSQLVAVLLVLLSASASAYAQESPGQNQRPAPTIGLALSGGGAKGFAHIGVLNALEKRGISVDVISGTSMGSVIGSLYAVGYSPDSIAAVARTQDWEQIFDDRPSRRELPLNRRLDATRPLFRVPLRNGSPQLPTALLEGQRVSMLMTRLLLSAHDVEDFTSLPTPFAAVATELATGNAVRFTEGFLPQVVRASMAIPSLFTPVIIDGRSYVDGGVARNLPAEDARALGADVVICSDVGQSLIPPDSINTFVDVLFQSVGYRMAQSNVRQKKLCDVVITPKLESYSILSFDAVDSLITRGTRAVEQKSRAGDTVLRSLSDAPTDSSSFPPDRQTDDWRHQRPLQPDTICVSEVTVNDSASPLRSQIKSALDVQVPSCLSIQNLEERVNRLYGLGWFDRVSYRLMSHEQRTRVDTPPGFLLQIRADEKQDGSVGFGFRYDTPYKASLLFTGAQPLGGPTGGRIQGEVQLGEVLRARVQFEQPFSLNPPSGLYLTTNVHHFPLDVYETGTRIARADLDVVSGRFNLWSTLQQNLGITIGTGVELFWTTPSAGPSSVTSGLDDDDELVSVEGQVLYDTFPVAAYPQRGVRGLLKSEATWRMGPDLPFTQYLLDAEGRLPVSKSLSLTAHLTAGFSTGGPLPLHHLFYLGGAHETGLLPEQQFSFSGYSVQAKSGRQMWAAAGGIQLQLPFGLIAMPRWNAGMMTDEREAWTDPASIFTGMGLTLGRKTLIGPVNLTVMAADWAGPYSLRVSAGPTF